MVAFRAATVGDATEVIGQLQARANACVHYVSSVSPTLHVYQVTGDVNVQTLRQQWLQWPVVSRVDADARVDPH